MSDVQTSKADPFKRALMSSEAKESQVGFDLRDEARPSDTRGINTKGGRCFFMGTGWQAQTMAKPKIRIHRKLEEKKEVQTRLSRNGTKLSAPEVRREFVSMAYQKGYQAALCALPLEAAVNVA